MLTTVLGRFAYGATAGATAILGFVGILAWFDKKSGKSTKLDSDEMVMIELLGAGLGVFYAMLRTAEDLVRR